MKEIPENIKLSVRFPEIAKEWNYEKNGRLRPENVSYGSQQKVWWKCHKCNCEFENKIINRRKCPQCWEVRLSDKNRLSIVNPELCKEWDYTKNSLRPEDVSYGSEKRVYWICQYGHSFKSSIYNRKRNGCPYCSGHKLSDKNRLSVTHPELCEEWDYDKNAELIPENVSYGLNKKIWWRCKKCNYSWMATLNSRSYGSYKNLTSTARKKDGEGSSCPVCSGKILSDKNRLSILRPDICKIWNYKRNEFTPNDFTNKSHVKAWFICSKRHEWETSILGVGGCPYCSNKAVNKENCLKTTFPELAKEWDYNKNPFGPESIVGKSNKKIWWKCSKNGHSWNDTPNHRSSGVRNCPFCSSHRACKDNCLATLNPETAKEWHPILNGKLTPENITAKSFKKIWWLCAKKGHVWKTAVSNRVVGGTDCPVCAKIILIDGNSFDSLVEAYLYLKLKGKGFKLEMHKLYGFGKFRCDFYLPETNTYIEVTSYQKNMGNLGSRHQKIWDNYYAKILRKKFYVEKVLMAKFRFIQFALNSKQRILVGKHVV